MKFLYSTVLALAAAGVKAQNVNPAAINSASDLYTAWNMDEPTISYDTTGNIFTLDYTTTSAGSLFSSNVHINEDFYDINCKDQGDGNAENRITAGIVDPTDDTQFPSAQQLTNGDVQLKFKIQPEVVNVATDPWYSDDGAGTGTLDFCVRTTLGYGGSSINSSLDTQLAGSYQEVNFIESLITVTYDLSAGFTTVSASVKPKDRETTTATEDNYTLVAWICDVSTTAASESYTATTNQVVYTYPAALQYTAFEQGSLIPVCIRPDNLAYNEGIVMRHLNSFDWNRTAPVYGNVNQNAIKEAPGVVADNRLTYHGGCDGSHYCLFQSVLFADFYVTAGTVDGSGEATVKYSSSTRRLAEGEQRMLQEGGSPFDVSVPLQGDVEGPGALKTAGGVTLGLTALASAVALVSAGLMA